MKHLIVGLSMIMMFVGVAVYFMFDMKKQHTKAFYTSEVRGYVIGKGLTDRATPYFTLQTQNGPTDVLVGSNAVYENTDLYDVVLKHANCDAVRVLKSGGEVLCANMLTPLELQMVMTQQEIGNYCNCASIAEPEPVEEEEIDSLEVDEVIADSVHAIAYSIAEVPAEHRHEVKTLYLKMSDSDLPDSICLLPNLTSLWLWYNPIDTLDVSKLACLDSLRRLDVSYTTITHMVGDPQALKNLKRLYILYNSFEKMPELICALTELEDMNLNNIDNKMEIPDCIANLTQLRMLILHTRIDEPGSEYTEAEQKRIKKLLPHCFVKF